LKKEIKMIFTKIFKLEKLEKWVIIVLSFLVFILANYVVSFFSFKIDLSFGKAYSLSSSTKKIIKNLDDVLNIKFFVSSDLPVRLLPLKNEVLDFLKEYQKEGKGKIIVKVLDPKKDESAKNQAQEAGLPTLQFSELQQNKYQVSSIYFGVVLSYGTKKEILPQVTNLEDLEYNLTSQIFKMTKKEVEKIAILGKEEKFNPQEDDLLTFKNAAKQQFVLDFIDISSSSATKEIDKIYKAVIVFDNNQKEYDSQEITAIKNYLQKGGKGLFFVDGVWVKDNLQAVPAKHNLFSVFADFGIEVKKNLLLSSSSELVNFGNQLFQFITPYPFWIKTSVFSQNQPFFSNIQQLLFPWVSQIEIKDKNKALPLVFTSKKSWEQKENFILDPQSIPEPNPKDLKQFIISSYGKNKNQGEIVVVPSSRFIQERYLSRTNDNLEFVLNVLNNLVAKGDLSGIRQRVVLFYPLPELSESQKDLFKYLNIFLLPSIFGLLGVFRLTKRASQ
jgi:ABC-type uncharacterized transport system involved in gliding motility auxiliary subunit